MLEIAAPQSVPAAPQVAPTTPASHHMSFREVLSALNPLQYLPVIGTIYRAVTGDQIPEPLRRVGSLIASGLLGGPFGVVIGIAVMTGEKVSGIDLDKAGQRMLTGHASVPAPAAKPEPAPVREPGSDNRSPPAFAGVEAWSPVQFAAYRASTATGNAVGRTDLSDADALNALELSRLQMARSAYSRAVGLAQ